MFEVAGWDVVVVGIWQCLDVGMVGMRQWLGCNNGWDVWDETMVGMWQWLGCGSCWDMAMFGCGNGWDETMVGMWQLLR